MYRNNVTVALADTFPTVAAWLGRARFGAFALAHVRRFPLVSPVLADVAALPGLRFGFVPACCLLACTGNAVSLWAALQEPAGQPPAPAQADFDLSATLALLLTSQALAGVEAGEPMPVFSESGALP